MMGYKGQPKRIIGNPGPDALSRRGVPPVLNVSLEELPACGAEDVGARLLGCRLNQSHDILKLVAKSVSAGRLVKRRARPDAAAQHLIKQPAVKEKVERSIGSLDLHGFEERVPACLNI